MRVRAALESDAIVLPAIERSAAEVFRTAPGLGWIADDDVQSEAQHRAHARDGTSWVAVDDRNSPFGFLLAEFCGQDFHICELAVRHDKQGRSAGRALFEAAVQCARQRGMTAVTLTTFRDVRWNELLYQRWGFETLVAETLGERLAEILAKEARRGLPGHQRCAMRLTL